MMQLYSIAACVLLLAMAGCTNGEKNKAQSIDPSMRGDMMKQVIAIQTELFRPSASPKLKERYQKLSEDIPFAVVLTDAEGNVLEANSRYQHITGYNLDELRQLTYQQLTPEKWQQAEAEFVAIANTVPYVAFEKEYLKKNGQVVPISLTGWVIKDANGKVVGTGSFITDITDRIRNEGF
ncbi:MAG: PAS domain S-box protein [Verrucomicrobia bacterium]|nr:PAS domain S-box protein [Verrucomicrobiota bacterium]